MTPDVDVDVAVVTWNTADLSAQLLRRLCGSDQGVRFRVLVRDNASTDGTAERLRAAVPEADIDAGNRNLGFAGGVNTLLARSTAPYVFILNGDACPEPAALSRLVSVARSHPRVAAVAPRLQRPDGGLEHSTYPFPSLLVAALFATGARERLPRRMAERLCLDGDWRHDRGRRVDWAYGAALLIPRDAVDAIGGFDESFFMYAEDVEWCWRAAGYGWSVWFEPSAVVTHVGNMSGAQAYGDERQALIIRNTQRLYRERRGALAAKVYRRLNARAADRAARKAQRHGDTGEATYWSRVRELHRSL